MKFNEKELELISGGIISSYVNMHFLEEAKRLNVFKQKAKQNVGRTLSDLIDIETNLFIPIDDVDGTDLSDKLVANHLTFIDEFLKFDFHDFSKLQEVFVAFTVDPKRLTGISDKILLENGGSKV